MERSCADRHNDDQNEGDQFCSYSKFQGSPDKRASYISESKAQTLVKGGKSGKTLILKLIQSETCESWFQELFLRRSGGTGVQIPKQLVSLDEKYLKRCLELMHMNGLKGAPCALSVNLNSFNSGLVSDNAEVGRRSSLDLTNYAIDYPMTAGTGGLDSNLRDEEIVGSIMGSNSMMKILRSPLFQRLGLLDYNNANLGGTNLSENKIGIPSSEYKASPSRLTSSLTHSPEKEPLAHRNQGYESDSVQRSPMSISSDVSVLTNQYTAFASQGMLHLMWNNGIPHFTFTLDDQKEVYVANACRVEATSNKALDYVYTFHLKATGPKLFDSAENELDIMGKMKVSTAFSLSPSNSRIMETEFVLVGTNDHHARETHTFSRNSRRSRKFSKVMDVFKSGHSLKQRSPSLFSGSSTIPEDVTPVKGLETCCTTYPECKTDLSEYDFLPNHELAAIVVKSQLSEEHHPKKKVGGWGLKFLEKSGNKQKVTSSEVSVSSQSCRRSAGDCSTSMDIIVPSGLHGGPRTKIGGPNSLVKRWRSGGNCDCGGWDMGCPLKILKAMPRKEEDRPSNDAQGECRSFDIFTEGSTQGIVPLKMVNIRDGLYFISFQPSFLSALQCFSIAVAIVHSQSPGLRPRHVQD